jgi:hypothetical protein
MSKVLLHSGTLCPFVHRQTQSALAVESGRNAANPAAARMAAIFMACTFSESPTMGALRDQ